MANATVPQDFIYAVADEIANGVDEAVEFWMAQIESALTDQRLTTLGRMDAIREILLQYKTVTGKAQLVGGSGYSACGAA